MSDIELRTIVSQNASNEPPASPDAGAHKLRNILGVGVSVHTKQSAIARIARLIAAKTHTKICFLNAHGANLAWNDQNYTAVLGDFEVLSDGIGVDIGSLINYGTGFPENLNGTDFVPALLAALPEDTNIALLGAAPGVADEAIKNLQTLYPQHRFQLVSHGFFDTDLENKFLDGLRKSKPDILLVALGNPAQEMWIAKNCNGENCTIAMAVGAYFDFAAGRVPRAPMLLRVLRMEWVFRLWLEPGRMWRRYVIGNPLFIIRAILQKFGRQDRQGRQSHL